MGEIIANGSQSVELKGNLANLDVNISEDVELDTVQSLLDRVLKLSKEEQTTILLALLDRM